MRLIPRLLVFVLFFARTASAAEPGRDVAIIVSSSVGRAPRHGLEKLETALRAQGWVIEQAPSLEAARAQHVIIAGLSTAGAGGNLQGLRLPSLPAAPEALAIQKVKLNGKSVLELFGSDERGLMYAVLDAAEHVGWSRDKSDPFREIQEVTEQPAIHERSLSIYTMNRANWESRFYDEPYWIRYFDLLSANRFNRFLIAFGYENGGFLAPPYPYFFDTPGFSGVHMVGLRSDEQQRNLAALNRLIELAHDRGIAVSLGIWDHIYNGGVQTGGVEWLDHYKGGPVPNTVEGVTSENLSAYTLASLKELITRVPALDGFQFRVHEESGLKREEMDGFWREVFQYVQKQKPSLQIEARGKGTPDSVIETALSQGVNLRIETKFWMEQMGLPFHPTHVNPQDQGNRRHGYADFLRYPQRYQMSWRLWNGGTSRILLWGDPDYVKRYSAAAALYNSPNWDVQEPLATKMEGQRPDMPVFDLMPAKYRYTDYEFERYWYFFKVWGRVGYNPNAAPDLWRHEFVRRFGEAAAPHLEVALNRASGILPMLVASSCYPYSGFPTTRGWAERQTLGATLEAYAKNTGTDTEQFESFEDAARRLLAGGVTAKRTPADTAFWLESTAKAVLESVHAAEAAVGSQRGNEFDSTITDLQILAQLARFHARRSYAAVHYDLYKFGHRAEELMAATIAEREAIAAWRDLVTAAGDRYTFDLAMGARKFDLCGHWRDEIPRLEAGLKELEIQNEKLVPTVPGALDAVATKKPPADLYKDTRIETGARLDYALLPHAKPGQSTRIVVRSMKDKTPTTVILHYRHVNQTEDYVTLPMKPTEPAGDYAATIPGEFLVPQWDVMFFVEVIDQSGRGTLWPDLAQTAPYIIVPLDRGK